MARGRRRLVITEAFGYTLDVYRVFILSLLHTGYRGDIKICAPKNRTRPEAAAFLVEHGVELVHTRPSKWHNSDRFATYAELCDRARYDMCLVADFRDVFFQARLLPCLHACMHARLHARLPTDIPRFPCHLVLTLCFHSSCVRPAPHGIPRCPPRP
jgi:hypothetical protein